MSYRAHLAGLCLAVVASSAAFGGALASTAEAQATAIAPYFLLVVDNSGSMAAVTADYGCSPYNGTSMATCTSHTGCSWFTTGTRCVATECFTQTTNTACGAVVGCAWNAGSGQCRGNGATLNSCNQDHTRINDARCVMASVVGAYGDVQFGLMRYNETVTGTCAAPVATAACNGGNVNSGQLLAPIRPQGGAAVASWGDFTCTGGFDDISMNPELRADTNTPIAGTVRGARSYFEGTALYSTIAGDPCAAHTAAGMAACTGDTANNCGWFTTPNRCRIRSPITSSLIDQTCRPTALIFLTDGAETCSTTADAQAAVDELYASTAAGTLDSMGNPRHILSYFIGFGMTPPDVDIEAYATHGGTDAPGAFRGFYATDETSLALAFSQIIADSILIESCNSRDDDCDLAVDEGFTLYCNLPSHPARDLCVPPTETLCNSIDDNCDGRVDEGLRNACGTCGAAPLEVCDLIDNDCDIAIDEGVCGGCVPSVEICNNLDDDCNGVIDNITRPCGMAVGICTTGTQTCTAGVWGMCSGINPGLEICDGIDNDCDGVIDGQVSSCGSSVGACRPGSQICTMGTLGPCIGSIGPTAERCDLIDNNCNGMTDEGDPGGGGTCGAAVGVCTAGTYHCVGGALTCTGGTTGSAELCDNIDNDCDGSIDEGIASPGACVGGSSTGVCRPGNRVCMGGAFVCQGAVGPSTELCDTLDNDCDGMVDESNPEGGVACGDDTGACMSGTTQCVGGVLMCQGAVGPTTEVCNAIDDDCNGVVDDGIPVGAPCGSSMGECTPGVFICDTTTGMLTCNGGISGIPELCDTLDNDCDGAIDESVGAGGACGSSTGACMMGINQCVGGAIMCVGEVPPTTEICDCMDNDCNGMTDDPPTGGSLCPGGSACVMCQCASACVHSEFGDRCPDGTTPFNHDGICSCVAPACDAVTCGGQTLMDSSGAVECAPTPGTTNVGPCVCRNNTCTFACEGVTCMGALTCDPRTGACVENSCRGLGCPTGELCNTTSGACEADPCATTTCGADQACRGGTCEDTCASATCTTGQLCHAGVCTDDECIGVTCPSGQTCDHTDGSCNVNRCPGVTCAGTETCDPLTGTCHGDPCVGLHCPSMTMCTAGECVDQVVMPDAGPNHDAGVPGTDTGVPGVDSGTTTRDDRHRVLASGGPLCSVGVAHTSEGGVRALLAVLALAGVLAARRRGSRRNLGRGRGDER